MSMVRTEVHFATGLPKDHGWSRAWECVLPVGTAHVCLALHGSHARAQGGNFRYLIQQAEAETVEQLYQVLVDLLDKANDAKLNCSLAVLVTVGDILTVFSYKGAVVLERQGKRRVLLAPTGALTVREGKVQVADQVLLCTQESWRTIQPLLEKVALLANLSEFIAQTQTLVRNFPDSSTAAVIGVEYLNEEGEKTEKQGAAPPVVKPTKTASTSPSRTAGMLAGFAVGVKWLVRSIQRTLGKLIGWVWTVAKSFGAGLRSLVLIVARPGKTTVGAHVSPKKIWLLLIVLALLLVGTIVVTYRYQQRAQFEQQIERQLEPYQQRLSQIEQLADVNPVQSRDDLLGLLQDLSTLEQQIDPTQPGYEQITDFLLRAQTLLDQFAASQAISELPIFKDARTISPSFLTTASTYDSERALLLDSQQQFVIALELFDRAGQELVLPAELEARAMTLLDATTYVLGNGLFTLGTTPESTTSTPESTELAEADEVLTGSTFLSGYASYLYLLNPSNRAIYRYTISGGSLSDRTTWVGASVGVPFETVTSMVVDGAIWLGTNDGKILKLQSGATQPFSLETIPNPPNSNLYITTTDRTDLLYILEPAQNRVLSVDKATGNVLAQVENSALGSASALILDQVNNQVLAVSGSLLFSVPIGVSF